MGEARESSEATIESLEYRTTIDIQLEKVAKGFGKCPAVSSCYSAEEHRASRSGNY